MDSVECRETRTALPDPLKTEWIVEGPYTIAGSFVVPSYMVDHTQDDTPAIAYDPATRPELVQALAHVCDEGEPGILRFTNDYGLLGYQDLVRVRKYHRGDPVEWVFAHARTVKLCLELTRLLMRRDRKGLEAYLQVGEWGYQFSCATRDVVSDRGFFVTHGDIFDQARYIRRGLINANIRGISPFIRVVKKGTTERETASFGFSALIEVIYQHLADVVTQGRAIRQCAADDCSALFVQTHKSQRYCAPMGKQKESPCARRMRARRQKQP
jgi:hypothetical protein